MQSHLKIELNGPVLLLMGPIGNFFARFARYLIKKRIPVYKIMFPLHEFAIPKQCQHRFDKSMDEWRPFLVKFLQTYQIKQLYMYGDFIEPHKIAIEEATKLGLKVYVFELGYVRPYYVTVEEGRVNARSNLNKPVEFYEKLPEVVNLSLPQHTGLLWRKLFMAPTFIQHALTNYTIIAGDHKLQPKPSYLYFQMIGYFRYFKYQLTEYSLRKKLSKLPSHFLVPLQVSIDSQITLASNYPTIEMFIMEILESFGANAAKDTFLIFKHHPRDRGYNNYAQFIRQKAYEMNLMDRVYYVHDADLLELYRNCQGVITVNSSVGLSSLLNDIPTKALGKTFYNLPGLTSQCSLDEFWQSPGKVNRSLFKKFYNYLITHTQINADFHGKFPFDEVFVA